MFGEDLQGESVESDFASVPCAHHGFALVEFGLFVG
jgi:hypothetical protein